MKNKIVKGLLMGLSVIFAATQNPETVVWAGVILTSICVTLGYYAKNWWFESASEDGVFDWRDVASALIILVVTAIPESINQIVVDGVINTGQLLKVVASVIFTYFTATFFSTGKRANS